jgi:hypothetical protein
VTPTRPARRRIGRVPTIGIAALLAAAAAGVALVIAAGDDDSAPRPGDLADPGVSHVHGLGINPADGSLIVATHSGSFRIPADGDDAERIGDSFQDTMGFTVVGPDRFLGSGHPDVAGLQAGQPGLLGLIESTDAGRTWESVALSGQVDFHGLAFAHDQVYGWDSTSGRFMVSANRVDWDGRSTLDLYAFAVDPDDPDHIVAATPDGLADSTDGGRSWQPSDGPTLLTLSWDPDAGLWGAEPDRHVWRNDAAEWAQAGRLPGQPQALLATPDALYAAVHDAGDVTAIYRSTDDGATWQLRYRDPQQ